MHRIDADAHVTNLFDPGDPLVPRLPTQADHHWLNAVQEELANAIVGAGVALVKGTNTQLKRILGLNGSGDPAPGARYFNDLLDVVRTATGTGIKAIRGTILAGDPDDVAVEGQAADATGVRGTTTDGVGVHAKATGTGNALKVEGYANLDAALVSSIPLYSYPSIPGTVAAAGTVIYVGGALNKAYCSDGSAWNALW